MNRFWANYDLAGNDLEPQWLKLEGYRLDLQTEAALTFIDRNHQQPFFFYLPYFAPHVPMEATQKYLDRFPGDMPERRRYCLAMLSAIDDGVGRLLDRLEEHGIADNTFIFFISDNGAPLKIDKKDIPISFPGGAWDGSLNDPWVGEKGMLSEGGIRVPFIISWPAGLPRGIVSDEPVIALDVAATSVALAGLQSDNELDGVNLIPFLSGKKSKLKRKALYWRFWDQSAIRMGKWKLLKAGRREYLFDLDSPAHERKNLIRQYPGKAKKLKKQLEKWGASLKTPGIPDGALKRELKWYDYYFAGMH
jgi:arylsulfatase A-like enzyme